MLPNSSVAADFALPDLPRSMVHGRDDIAGLVDRLAAAGHANPEGHAAPTEDECDLVAEILRAGRSPS
ncbi:hypothetical protein [Janibacter melonis]|uniref:hypothetical protein n=1 Tax=Janibacter melonis TaxID=262209 RepID=UPI002094AB79|nr:hypothetical protein [Janibacter melonis]